MMYLVLVEIVLLMVILAALIVLAVLAIEWWAVEAVRSAKEHSKALETENAQLKAQLHDTKQASLASFNKAQAYYDRQLRQERREASKESNRLKKQLKSAMWTIRELHLRLGKTIPTGASAAIAQYYVQEIVDQIAAIDESP